MHNLIVGKSGTGKSNLAKRLANDLSKRGNILVYDPTRAKGWAKGSKKFHRPDAFFDYIRSAKNAFVFIDEAKTLWDEDQKEADRILYSRRHQGLLIFLIAQRTKMVPPNGRNQCSKVFALAQQKFDADILVDEYTDEMGGVRSLAPGEILATDGFKTEKMQLVYGSKKFPEETDEPPKIKMLDTLG